MSMSFLSPVLYFSYSQFLVYDQVVTSPGLRWTKRHFEQGFARKNSTVCFRTLLEHGMARVTASFSPYVPGTGERVIAVPFEVVSGNVIIEGPEESEIDRKLTISPGYYRLIAAQTLVNADDENGEESIALFFETTPHPIGESQILVADNQLGSTKVLMENAETP